MFRSNFTPKTPNNNVTQILWPSLFLDQTYEKDDTYKKIVILLIMVMTCKCHLLKGKLLFSFGLSLPIALLQKRECSFLQTFSVPVT